MKSIDQTTSLSDIDPAWAWQPWEPTESEAWDSRRAASLFRRATFGASDATIRSAVQQSPSAVVDQLLNRVESDRMTAFESDSHLLAEAVRASGNAKQLSAWWLHRMLNSPRPLIEKMTLFWHGHFATGAEKVKDIELMLEQNRHFREHALGDFSSMVHGISKDPAMLIYLDSVTNRKAHANENFARELMELFCLGEGNYTEGDVQQLARCFTGWEIRRKRFRFNRFQHDIETKRLFGNEVESGEEAVDQVLANKHLPYFITRKLFRFFVCDEPEPNERLLEPLARKFSKNHLSLNELVQTILSSRLMLSNWSIGRKVRSPVELAIGLLTTLEATTNLSQLSDRLRDIGQSVFFPPNVKGWDGGRAWVNSSTLVGRANLVHELIRDEHTRFADGGIEKIGTNKGRSNGIANGFLDWFSEIFLAIPLTDQQHHDLTVSFSKQPKQSVCRELLSLLATMPQFQLA